MRTDEELINDMANEIALLKRKILVLEEELERAHRKPKQVQDENARLKALIAVSQNVATYAEDMANMAKQLAEARDDAKRAQEALRDERIRANSTISQLRRERDVRTKKIERMEKDLVKYYRAWRELAEA